jgi:hypothetical protein
VAQEYLTLQYEANFKEKKELNDNKISLGKDK